MKPRVVRLLLACGLPVAFSAALQTHTELQHVHKPPHGLKCMLMVIYCKPQHQQILCLSPLDLGINRLLFCFHHTWPSAMLQELLLYTKLSGLSKKVTLHMVLCLQHRDMHQKAKKGILTRHDLMVTLFASGVRAEYNVRQVARAARTVPAAAMPGKGRRRCGCMQAPESVWS